MLYDQYDNATEVFGSWEEWGSLWCNDFLGSDPNHKYQKEDFVYEQLPSVPVSPEGFECSVILPMDRCEKYLKDRRAKRPEQ
eukprot:3222691-Karenia_brevis.AAC.1